MTHGDVERVRELLAAGVDVDARNRYGQTALMLGAQRGHLETEKTAYDLALAPEMSELYADLERA